ncbi:MAG: YopT-type cysteine protease domain-containing protein [Pseudomonadota bacterium]|nr:YopT-type cysteine protease domain-containing protein [Pseudomonadota bacterium]
MPNRAYALNNVQQLVDNYDGVCTWDFSQGLPLDFIAGPAGNGICLALSCHWIKYHALDDSLVNHLGGIWNPANRTYIQFNHQEYQRIAQWQRNLERFPDWIMGYQNWLRNQGLGANRGTTVPMSASALRTELERIHGGYAMIILKSRNVRESHAIAVYIGEQGGDACFFDPNFGEYWFPNRDDFFFFLHLFANFVYHRNHRDNVGFDSHEIIRVWR